MNFLRAGKDIRAEPPFHSSPLLEHRLPNVSFIRVVLEGALLPYWPLTIWNYYSDFTHAGPQHILTFYLLCYICLVLHLTFHCPPFSGAFIPCGTSNPYNNTGHSFQECIGSKNLNISHTVLHIKLFKNGVNQLKCIFRKNSHNYCRSHMHAFIFHLLLQT